MVIKTYLRVCQLLNVPAMYARWLDAFQASYQEESQRHEEWKQRGKREFIWTKYYYEAKLLLNVTRDYKIQQVIDDMCWESVKRKYVDILEI